MNWRGWIQTGLCALLFSTMASGALAQEEAPLPVPETTEKVLKRISPPAEKGGLETVISVNVRDMDLAQAVRLLAQEAGVNVAMGKDVDGTVTCSLTDVTARVALEAFLRSNGYDFVKTEDVLVVVRQDQVAAFRTVPATRKIIRKSFRVPYTGRERDFTAGGTTGGAAGGTGGGRTATSPVDEAIRDMLSPRGKMAYYERQHLVVVEDDEANIAMIDQFVKELWEVPKQIFIDSKLIEVSLEEGEDLGMRWSVIQKVSRHGKRSLTVGGDDRRGTMIETTAPTLGLDRAFTYGVVNANIEVVLEAFSSRRRVDLRSNPRVLVINHRTATIIVGQEIPYLSSIETVAGGGTPIRTYEFKEIAMRLDVTPHVSEDNMVFLDVRTTVKSQIGWTEEPRQPILSTREAVTNVVVKDGATLIIGGLVQRSITKAWAETPYVARIPLIGWFFRQRGRQDTKNDLIFLLSPRVVTPELVRGIISSKEGIMVEPPVHAGESEPGRPKW